MTDANNCTDTESFIITEPDELLIQDATTSTEIECFGDDGEIKVDITQESIGDYTFNLIGISDSSINESVTTNQLSHTFSPKAGTYKVRVTDINGCFKETNQITLTQPSEGLSILDSITNITCKGGNDGAIDVTISGGTAGYSYSWTGPNSFSSTSTDLTNLSSGTYNLTVTDNNGCIITKSFTMSEPDELVATASLSDFNGFGISCNGADDGSIDLSVSGGTATYSYAWTGPNSFTSTNEDLTDLSPGTYTVVVTDANNCTDTESFIITEPEPISVSEILSDYNGYNISETGNRDGAIDISVSGGSLSFTFLWTTVDGSGLSENEEDQESLSAGTYNVTITDSNGCVFSKEYIFNQPNELIISIDNDAYKSDVFCFGDEAASIKVDVKQESVGPYTYSIEGLTYLEENYSKTFNDISDLSYTFSELPAGSYLVTVKDANGSKKTITKEIFGPDKPLSFISEISNYEEFNISCPGANDGFIKLTTSGGGGSSNQSKYFYSWTTSDGDGLSPEAKDQSNLGPGTYTVTITDINECSITESFTLVEPSLLNYNLDSLKNITCNGDDDGEINITITGGTGNYEFLWSTENGDGLIEDKEDQAGLSPGNYKLILRDGCNTFEYIYTISSPDVLEISLEEKLDILCNNSSTGFIDITVSGGTLPYNYVWKDNFGNVYDRNVGDVFNDGDLSNIPAGIYNLTVTDSNGCVATFSIELTQPEDLIIDIQKTDLNCYNSNNGTIKVTPFGGLAPYSYSWSDFGNGNEREGLSAGLYTVTVTDSYGCEEVIEIEIENAELFDVNPVVTPVSCFGANDGSIEMNFVGGVAPITFTWSDDSTAGQNRYNLSPKQYSVLIKDASGCEIQRDFTIIEPKEISIAGVITDAIDCDNPESGSIDLQVSGGNLPYTFLWSNGATTEDVSNLLANNYSVKITDSKGCTAEKEFAINRQEDLEISLQSDFFAICETKEVYQKNIVTILGGVAPYTIEWSNGLVTGGNNEIMDTKIEGSYQVIVTDFLGCSESVVFDVTTPIIGSPNFEYDSFYLETYEALAVNDPIAFTNLSTEEYTNVSWNFGDGNTSNEENPVHTYLSRGEYDVTLTVEFILGCSYSITKTIYVGDPYEIVIPNAFTPNNDNFNDVFRPIYYGFKNINIGIYDTWGTLIYYEETLANEMIGWDGKVKGKEAENGNYFFQVTGKTHTDEKFSKNGSFTLIK